MVMKPEIKAIYNDDELAKWAAKGCFNPAINQEHAAMQWTIERLVLPKDISGYTEEEIEKFIFLALTQRENNER